jgi:hypothetical protein
VAFSVPDRSVVNDLYADWAGRGLAIAQRPTAMDFGYTFVALDRDGHRLRVLALEMWFPLTLKNKGAIFSSRLVTFPISPRLFAPRSYRRRAAPVFTGEKAVVLGDHKNDGDWMDKHTTGALRRAGILLAVLALGAADWRRTAAAGAARRK